MIQRRVNAVEMKHVTMRFPGVLANDRVDFSVRKGEIHALVGENGAGKTTLMNVLYGLYQPTEGEIWINGEKKVFSSALNAIQAGIGMVHQHFMLIPRLTIAENIVLGQEPRTSRIILDRKAAAENVGKIFEQYNFHLNPKNKVCDISLGARQKVEIAKALYRKADILILDEPTAVLTPQEIDELGGILQDLKQAGKSVIIITHKLKEVMTFSDRITVLRTGRVVETVDKENTDENQITQAMVGREVSMERSRNEITATETMLEFRNVSYKDMIRNASFQVRKGEILGIAGIDNSGQQQLTELAAGVLKPTTGSVLLDGEDITHISVAQRKRLGIGFIPQDRQRAGLVLGMSIEDNLLIGYQRDREYRIYGMFENRKAITRDAVHKVKQFDIRPANEKALTKNLSGGNQQKVVIARESSRASRLIVADQPSRGVDVGAIELIYQVFSKACQEGKAVLLSSLELDELMMICDRIMVIAHGAVQGIVDAKTATRYEIGALMLAGKEDERYA